VHARYTHMHVGLLKVVWSE